jgi:hypothetical protein
MWYVDLYEAKEDDNYLGSVGPFPNTIRMLEWKESHQRSPESTPCRYQYFHLFSSDQGFKL